MLELYHWEPNGLFLKPLIALKEKNAEFTSHYYDPTSLSQHSGQVQQNLESRLHLEREGPLLVHDGEVISSSFFMLEYISEALPGPDLNPGGAYEHYKARALGQLVALSLGAGVSALGCAKYLAPVLAKQPGAELRARLERIEPQERRGAWLAVTDGSYSAAVLATVRVRLKFPVKRIEDALATAAWLTGPQYSIADIDAFAMLATLPDLAPDVVNSRDTPRILEFLNRVRERAAVKAALALSRTGKPHEAFIPGAEASRWG
jgi:glutathione S-transferase